MDKVSEPDKSLDWRVRKQDAIERAATESDVGALALVAADKLDNIRSLEETLRSRGEEETWRICSADRKSQHWFYRTMTQALLDRQPTNLLFRTLAAAVDEVFPEERPLSPS